MERQTRGGHYQIDPPLEGETRNVGKVVKIEHNCQC